MKKALVICCGAMLALGSPMSRAQEGASVKHGGDLVRGVNCGLPADAVLEKATETVFKEPVVVTGKLLGPVRTTHSEGVVKFVKCRFVNTGYVPLSEGDKATPGTAHFTVQRVGKGSVELEDCEVLGGKSVSIMGVDKITRTYVTGGNDLFRPPEGESYYTEVLGEGLIMDSPASHSDILQVTFGKDRTPDNPAVATIHLLRCKFDARSRTGADGRSLDAVNGAIQLGSFGPNTGVTGEITGCYFDGGAFSLAGGDHGDAGKPVVLRGNKFGRLSKYGPINPRWRENQDIDDSNVWADTGEPLKAR
ncbi:MAG: hypothetical protein J0I10_04620 [Verrucomicrobia bacterium]|nr:hypothetical protein [Verrucomicrobiota bacterium]